MNLSLVVGVFVWVFVVILIFIGFNTFIIGNFVPTMQTVANNSDFVDNTRYNAGASMATATFYGIFFIMGAAPFIYLLVRLLLKREPDPYERGYQ